MNIDKIAKQGKLLNGALIGATLIYFIIIQLSNILIEGNNDIGYVIFFAATVILILFSIVLLVFVILTYTKMKTIKLHGGGLMLSSAIVLLITAISMFFIGIMIGLIIFILSGISNKQIDNSKKLLMFEQQTHDELG